MSYLYHYIMIETFREKTEKERKKEEEKRKHEEAESAFQWWLGKKEDERREQTLVNKQVVYLCSWTTFGIVAARATAY